MTPPTLPELADKHGTDKGTFHGYMDIYQEALEPVRTTPIRFLEIGVDRGASLKMWREFFTLATIVGIDIDQRTPAVAGCELLIADAAKPGALGDIPGQWNVIVDDGSHYTADVIGAFEWLWPLVVPGGLYFIEDLYAVSEPDCEDLVTDYLLNTQRIDRRAMSVTFTHGLIIARKEQ